MKDNPATRAATATMVTVPADMRANPEAKGEANNLLIYA
jgi:hypothetical protein